VRATRLAAGHILELPSSQIHITPSFQASAVRNAPRYPSDGFADLSFPIAAKNHKHCQDPRPLASVECLR